MKSHGLAAAQIPFYKVLTSVNTTEKREVRALGQRCLTPGLYAEHLERWLSFYSPSQVTILYRILFLHESKRGFQKPSVYLTIL